MTQIRHEFDAETGITKEIKLTAKEIAEREAEEAAYQAARAAEQAAKEAAKQAVLSKLGLTAEELAAALS